MTHPDERDVARIAADVRKYLELHPHAMDTVEGITNWWLPILRYEEARERVQQALEYLESLGEIARRQMPDGRSLYLRSKGAGGTHRQHRIEEHHNGGVC